MKSPLIQLSKKALHPYFLLSAVMDENPPWIFHFFIRSTLARLIHQNHEKREPEGSLLKLILSLPTNCAGKIVCG